MLGVDEGANAALLLCFGHRVQRHGGLARAFRPVDLDDAALGQSADTQRNVQPQRPGRHRLDLDDLLVDAQTHDRALAEGAFDLRQRRVQCL